MDNTAKVGPFVIDSEGSVASGVRRIEAVTGKKCMEKMAQDRERLYKAAGALKVKPTELGDRIAAQVEEIKELKRSIDTFKARETAGEADRFLFGARNVGGVHVITATVNTGDSQQLRQMGDLLRDKDPDVVAVLCAVNEGKITFLAVSGKNAVAKGLRAGDLVKLVCTACGGSGGGKPDSAMGGGKDESKVDDALALVDDFVASKLN